MLNFDEFVAERTDFKTRVKAQQFKFKPLDKPIKNSKGHMVIGFTYTGPTFQKRDTAIAQDTDGKFFAVKEPGKKFKKPEQAAKAYFA